MDVHVSILLAIWCKCSLQCSNQYVVNWKQRTPEKCILNLDFTGLILHRGTWKPGLQLFLWTPGKKSGADLPSCLAMPLTVVMVIWPYCRSQWSFWVSQAVISHSGRLRAGWISPCSRIVSPFYPKWLTIWFYRHKGDEGILLLAANPQPLWRKCLLLQPRLQYVYFMGRVRIA